MRSAPIRANRDVVLERRLRTALTRLNPNLPTEALEDVHRKLMRVDAPSLVERNRAVHRMLVDWTVRENVRAALRVLVKRILRKYGYPPDKQEKATQTVIEQANALTEQWAV